MGVYGPEDIITKMFLIWKTRWDDPGLGSRPSS